MSDDGEDDDWDTGDESGEEQNLKNSKESFQDLAGQLVRQMSAENAGKSKPSNQNEPDREVKATKASMKAGADALNALFNRRAAGPDAKSKYIGVMSEEQGASVPEVSSPSSSPPISQSSADQVLHEELPKAEREAQSLAAEEETSELGKPDTLFIKGAQNLLDVFSEFASGDFNREYVENLIITLDNISQYEDLSEISSQIGHGEVPITWKSISHILKHELSERLSEEITEEQRHFISNYYKADDIFNFFNQEGYSQQLGIDELSGLKSALKNYIENPDANNAKILCEAWDRDQEYVVDISLEDQRSLTSEDQDKGYESGLENLGEAQAAAVESPAETTSTDVNAPAETIVPPPPGPAPDFTKATPASPASASTDAVEYDGYVSADANLEEERAHEETKKVERPDLPPKPQSTNANSLSSEERSEGAFLSTPEQDSESREESLLAAQASYDKKSKAEELRADEREVSEEALRNKAFQDAKAASLMRERLEEERSEADRAAAELAAAADSDSVKNKKPPIAKKPSEEEIAAYFEKKKATAAMPSAALPEIKPEEVAHLSIDVEQERMARRAAFKKRIQAFEPQDIASVGIRSYTRKGTAAEQIANAKLDAGKAKKATEAKKAKPEAKNKPKIEPFEHPTFERSVDDSASSKPASKFQQDMEGMDRMFNFSDVRGKLAQFAAGGSNPPARKEPISIDGYKPGSVKDRAADLGKKLGLTPKPTGGSGRKPGKVSVPKNKPQTSLDDLRAAAIAGALHDKVKPALDFPCVPKKFNARNANFKAFLEQVGNFPEVQSSKIVSEYKKVRESAETMVSNATFVAKSMEPLEKAKYETTEKGEEGWRKTYNVDVTKKGPLYMPRKSREGKTIRNASGEIVYDILFYDKKGSGFELNLDKSFIAPDDVPTGSYASITKDIREQVMNHHEQRFEKGLGKNKPKDISHSVSDLALEAVTKAASKHVTKPTPAGPAPSADEIKAGVKGHAAAPAPPPLPPKSKEQVAAELAAGKRDYKPVEIPKEEIARKAAQRAAGKGGGADASGGGG